MNEIEAKRKEMIENYNSLMEFCKHNQEAFDRLRGLMAQFQQLKEMARKEILDKIDKLITKWKDWYRFDVAQIDENWINEMEELKRSLEEKK